MVTNSLLTLLVLTCGIAAFYYNKLLSEYFAAAFMSAFSIILPSWMQKIDYFRIAYRIFFLVFSLFCISTAIFFTVLIFSNL